MKTLIIALITAVSIMLSKCSNQSKTVDVKNCMIEKNIHFEGERDTVLQIGAFLAVGEIGSTTILERLEKKAIVKAKEYEYAIKFTLEGCTNEYYLPCGDRKASDKLYFLKPGSKIRVTCVAFKEYQIDQGEPFFLISKVEIL